MLVNVLEIVGLGSRQISNTSDHCYLASGSKLVLIGLTFLMIIENRIDNIYVLP